MVSRSEVGAGLAVIGSGDGVGVFCAPEGSVSNTTAVEVTITLESDGVTSPTATSESSGADSSRVQATIVSKTNANGNMKTLSFVDMTHSSI